jgi:hypothetical protein
LQVLAQILTKGQNTYLTGDKSFCEESVRFFLQMTMYSLTLFYTLSAQRVLFLPQIEPSIL